MPYQFSCGLQGQSWRPVGVLRLLSMYMRDWPTSLLP